MKVRAIEVSVSGQKVGLLTQENENYVFTYLADTPEDHFVSLTMPVRNASYTYPTLHPVFDMSQPEGALKSALQAEFQKTLDMDPMGFLALTGRQRIGRVQYQARPPITLPKASVVDSKTVEALIEEDDVATLFHELVTRYGDKSGVSGVQPKVLANLLGQDDHGVDHEARQIIKISGHDYPYLALNESLCLSVAKAADLAVPEWKVLGAGQVIVVDRFDFDPESGGYLGFEEFASLMGVGADEKYNSHIERVVKGIFPYLSPATRRAELQKLFELFVLNNILRNGDAHLKNYGVLYLDIDNVLLAPAYDIVTTTAYIKSDLPAMLVGGRKAWADRKALVTLGMRCMQISKASAGETIDRISAAIEAMAPSIVSQIKANPGFADIGSRMLSQWNDGIKSLDAKKDSAKQKIHTNIDDLLAGLLK